VNVVAQPASTQVHSTRQKLWVRIKKHKALYVMLLFPVVYVFIFNYLPMYGVLIAFQDFMPRFGIAGSKWVGLKHFRRFVDSPMFFQTMRNTIILNVYGLLSIQMTILYI